MVWRMSESISRYCEGGSADCGVCQVKCGTEVPRRTKVHPTFACLPTRIAQVDGHTKL
jgi:hypothetical protein